MEEPKTGLVSMILGICSIVFSCLGIPALPIAAIVLAVITKNKIGAFEGKCKVGLITGIIGAVLCVIVCIIAMGTGFLAGMSNY